MPFNKNNSSVKDYEDVVAVVGGYVRGLKEGNVDTLKGAFLKDAIMYGYSPDGLLAGSIDNLYTFVEKYGKAEDIKVRLDVLDLTATTGVVKVTMENDAAGGDYTDFHLLLKIDGEWRVVAKLFHLYDK